MKERTLAYQFTVNSIDDKKLKKFRKQIKKTNKLMADLKEFNKCQGISMLGYKIEIKPRFGKNNPNIEKYHNYMYCRIEDGTYFDVYLRTYHSKRIKD